MLKVRLSLNLITETSRYEDEWGSGIRVPTILNLGIRRG
jgi:hypothetical protein